MSSATDILKERKNIDVIKQKFIHSVLIEEAINIEESQDRVINNYSVSNVIKESRTFAVTNNSISHRHSIRQRFIDMRRIRKGKQKPIPIHNKIIWGHLNSIIFKLAYGFTEDIKNTISKQYNIEL